MPRSTSITRVNTCQDCFWIHAMDYGWSLPIDAGAKGYKLSGRMDRVNTIIGILRDELKSMKLNKFLHFTYNSSDLN